MLQRSDDGMCGVCFVWTLDGVLVLSGHGLHKSRFTACLFFVSSAADRHRESETDGDGSRAQRTETAADSQTEAGPRQGEHSQTDSILDLEAPQSWHPLPRTPSPSHQSNPTTRDGRIGSARILASGPRKLGLDTNKNSLTWRPYEVSKRRGEASRGNANAWLQLAHWMCRKRPVPCQFRIADRRSFG